MPRKRFAQHWLRDDRALERIVAAAQLHEGDRVLEIGPGTGNLTRRLLAIARAVVAVEIDRDLCRKLVGKLGDRENFLLLQGDILDLDLPALLAAAPDKFHAPNKVVANIPYNITGPILERLLGTIAAPAEPACEAIVLLVQKEVADRLCAQPGSKAFGALTVRVGYLADCQFVCAVPAKAFYPAPKVDSAVVRLEPRPFAPAADDVKLLARLVKLGFASRRKMLRNNLKGILAGDRLEALFASLDLNPKIRAENLSIEDWVRLANELGRSRLETVENPIEN